MIPEKQKKFLEGYDGSCKGRYHIAYLAILGIAGGEEVKEEAIKKYGDRKAFKGWYMCHEIDTYNDKIMKVYRELGRHLKELKDMPILISPFIHGKKQFSEDPTNLAEHEKQWDRIFADISDCVDIVALQDGHVDYHEAGDKAEPV